MIQLAIIAAYLALLVGLGALANRLLQKTPRDYMLASQTIGPVLLLLSLFGTTMTAFALVGSTGEAYAIGAGVYGMLASSSGIVHSLCFFLIGVPLWRVGRRNGYTTQIQFFRDRLESNWIGLLLFPVLVSLIVPYLLIGVLGGGEFIERVSVGAFENWGWFASSGYGLPQWLASLLICMVVLTYVFFGGMRGTAWANALQTLFFMTIGVVTFLTIAKGLGGQDTLLENLQVATAGAAPDHLTRSKLPPPLFFSFLLIPLSVAMFPHIFQHWLTARSAESFKLPIVAHPLFIMIVWLPCVLIGVWASGALPEGSPPNQVLAALVQQNAGDVLAGLLTAGILAAIMSSLDSQFLCLGTIFTEDIVLHYGGKGRFSERQTVALARGFIVAIVAITYLLSLSDKSPRVFGLGIWSFSGFTGLFPLVFAAIYWRRLTSLGAAASVLAAAVAWGWMFYRSDFGLKRYSFPEAPITLGEITIVPPMLPVVTIFVVATAALVAVSLITPAPKEATMSRFFPAKRHG